MLSAPAHQIVLIVNGIYLLENLKLGDGALVDLAGLVESGRRAVVIPSRKATSGMARGRA